MLQFYGLQEHPFGTTPNPHFLFSSDTHRRAQASLALGIENQLGFTLLIAPPGLGKTTLLFDLLTKYRNHAQAAFVFTTQCSSLELLRYIATDLQIPGTEDEDDPVKLHRQFAQFVATNKFPLPVLVVIDEAQNLTPGALETVRLLSDFETPERKLLHIILAGQPKLKETLRSPELSQLLGRITSVTGLKPLSREETASYIDHRLRAAGFKDRHLFSEPAILKIAAESGGVPRSVNRICLNALRLGFDAKQRLIGCDLIEDAVAEFSLDDDVTPYTPLSAPSPTLPISEPVSLSKRNQTDAGIAIATRPAPLAERKHDTKSAPASSRGLMVEITAKVPSQTERRPSAPKIHPERSVAKPYELNRGASQFWWIALSIIVLALAVFGYMRWRVILGVAALFEQSSPSHAICATLKDDLPGLGSIRSDDQQPSAGWTAIGTALPSEQQWA